MSSRNGYLTAEQRQLAPMLFQALSAVRDGILSGNKNFPELLGRQAHILNAAGFNIDYFVVCRTVDLLLATAEDRNW